MLEPYGESNTAHLCLQSVAVQDHKSDKDMRCARRVVRGLLDEAMVCVFVRVYVCVCVCVCVRARAAFAFALRAQAMFANSRLLRLARKERCYT